MLHTYHKPLVSLITAFSIAGPLHRGIASDEQLPSGRLEFANTSYGFIVGYSEGGGTLYFNGGEYPFSVKGLKLGTVGVSKVEATGSVYNLNDIADFEGKYRALDAGLTLIQGGNVAILRNQKGVRISLQTYQHGAEMTLGVSGVDIVLQQALSDASGEAAAQSRETNQYYKKTELPPLELISQ